MDIRFNSLALYFCLILEITRGIGAGNGVNGHSFDWKVDQNYETSNYQLTPSSSSKDALVAKLKSMHTEISPAIYGAVVDSIREFFVSRGRRNDLSPEVNKTGDDLSKKCSNAIAGLAVRLTKNDTSEISNMLDADGKPGSGLFRGNIAWLGSFHECKNTGYAHLCMTQVNLLTLPLVLGLCVPKECNEEDVFQMLNDLSRLTNKILKKPILQVNGNNSFQQSYGMPAFCNDPVSYSTGNIIAFCITGFIGLLVLIGTFLDYAQNWFKPTTVVLSKSSGFMPVMGASDDDILSHNVVNESQPFLAQNDVKKSQKSLFAEILLCFSFRKNFKQIFNTDVASSAITCINGIRTISMTWVILGHTFYFSMYSASDNIMDALKVVHRLSFEAVANAYVSVDTFFLLSGLLVSYLCLKRFDKYDGSSFLRYFSKKFMPQYYLHRFLRLTPSYMYVILFFIFIFPFCGDGPLWFEKSKGMEIQNCKEHWWTNLLYINNFYPTSMGNECIGWSWYLANDMQFYLISPAILLVMHKLKLPGTLIISTAICIISFVVTGTIIGVNNLNSLLTGDFQGAQNAQTKEFADWIYSKPYCRIAPYIVGLALGGLIYNRKAPGGNAKTLLAFFGWTIATVVALLVIYGPYTYFRDGGRPFTSVENVMYGAFSRFAWSLCVAWVIYACYFGMGGLVNTILSWKAFIPLSRLTYSAYLVHPIVIYVYYGSLERPFHYSDISVVYTHASFLMLTYGSAFLLSIFVEFPASNLEKLSFRF